jgi:hypothetical protein
MATVTPNFNWPVPTSTDLVKDGATAIEALGDSIDASLVDLKGGTTGQVLAKQTNTDMDFAWVAQDDSNAIQNSIVNAKGDIIGASANDTPAITSVGANGTSLVADSTTATGLAYAARATLAANTFSADQTINTVRVGLGNSAIATNTALGFETLNSNTTGFENVALGRTALRSNTTGNRNTAAGVGALFANSTGGANTAVGWNCLSGNTTGSENTAMGHSASANNTTGFNNTAIGLFALNANSTGNGNTALGWASVQNTTGNDNTGVGKQSLYSATSGIQNTSLGSFALYSTTTGSNNTGIGYDAQPSSATVSNTITLGNSSIATLRCQVTSITSLSDERDKKDIAPLEHGLDFVKQLKPVSFEWNTRPETRTDIEGNEIEIQGKVGISDIGFIAQDIVALEDSLGAADSLQLSFRDNPEKLEVTQGRLIPILVKAIQDLTAKVEALEAAK